MIFFIQIHFNTTLLAKFIPMSTYLATLPLLGLHLLSKFPSARPFQSKSNRDIETWTNHLVKSWWLKCSFGWKLQEVPCPFSQSSYLAGNCSHEFWRCQKTPSNLTQAMFKCTGTSDITFSFLVMSLVLLIYKYDMWIHTGVPLQLACFPQDPIPSKKLQPFLRSQN